MSGSLSNIIVCPSGFAISAAGNPSGSNRASLRALSESLSMTFDRFETTNIHNSISMPADCAGVKRIGGSLTSAVHPEDIGYFLTTALGRAVETGVGPTRTHTFTDPSSNFSSTLALPAVTLEIYRAISANTAFLYSGLSSNTFSLSFAVNQDVRMSTELIGYDVITQNRAATQLFSNIPIRPFKFIDTGFSFGGASFPGVESFNLNVNNNLEGIASLNQDNRIYKISRAGPMTVTFDGTAEFETFDEYNAFANQDNFAIDIDISAGTRSLNISLPQCTYIAYPPSVAGRGRIITSFSGKCDLSAVDGHTIQATLVAERPSFFTLT